MKAVSSDIPFLRSNVLPEYDERLRLEENHERFMEWAVDLSRPMEQIPEIAEQYGFPSRRHPLGFIAVALSPRQHNQMDMSTGHARADIFPIGQTIEDDIHTHGFGFLSGVAAGIVHNTMHSIDFQNATPQDNGYLAYETRINEFGDNETVLIDPDPACYPMQSTTTVLRLGDTYTMRLREDFHSIAAESAVTVFCKTPTLPGRKGTAIFLRKSNQPEPPAFY